MTKRWRDFELLVARIEQLLSPKGAIITSPDRIRDKVTGQLREVDVSIRYTLGTVNILITLECRRRKDTPDVTWIEQLATKKQSIGASHTIAVSSTRFTGPATKSAKLYGIELRVVKDIADDDILSWLRRIRIVNEIGKVSFEGIRVKVYGEDEGLGLAPEVLGEIAKEKLQARIFYIKKDSKKASIASLLDYFVEVRHASERGLRKTDTSTKLTMKTGDTLTVELKPGYMSLFDDVPVNADDLGRITTFGFGILGGTALIETVQGPRYVKRVEVELVLAKETQEIPISRRLSYATTDEQIGTVLEADIELFQYDRKRELIVSYSIPQEEGGPVIVMVAEKGTRGSVGSNGNE